MPSDVECQDFTHPLKTISIDIKLPIVLYFGIFTRAALTLIRFGFPTHIDADDNPKPAPRPHL